VLAALAVGVTTLISLAVPMELERQWMTVAWAAEVLALVWLAERLDVPTLRRLAWILLAFVAIRLLANPQVVLAYPIGDVPFFNWLLYGYGLPILALAGASVLARRQGAARLAEALHWVSLGLVVAFVSLEIRQYFHRSQIGEGGFLLVEWGTYVIAWLGLAWGALRAARRYPMRPFEWGGRAMTVAAIGLGILSLGLASNPLWRHAAVGETLIVNRLLWCYGVPALLLFFLVRELEARQSKALGVVCAIASLATTFVLVTLEVRQAFHGAWLDSGPTTNAEQYAYSFAWIVLGLVLVVAGIASRARMLRYASLAVLLPAVFKVFLFDTANLEDLYRVFSLLALGVSLMLLAFLYKRFVFRDEGGA